MEDKNTEDLVQAIIRDLKNPTIPTAVVVDRYVFCRTKALRKRIIAGFSRLRRNMERWRREEEKKRTRTFSYRYRRYTSIVGKPKTDGNEGEACCTICDAQPFCESFNRKKEPLSAWCHERAREGCDVFFVETNNKRR